MHDKTASKLLAGAGVLCLVFAFVLLGSFKGEFGKDTAGKSSAVPVMEDTIDVTPSKSEESRAEPKQIAAVESGSAQTAGEKWVVYVTGAVKNPGVYEVAAGSRVYEALKAAGGFTANANQEAVNLAAKLQDGEQVKFFMKGEAVRQAAVPPSGTAPQAGTVNSAAPRAAPSGRININTASQSELESIRGVGPKTAQSIIDYRTQNGSFKRVEDIMNVKGIGEKKFDSMKDQISTGN